MSSAAPDDVLSLLRQRGRAPDPAALEGLMRGVVAAPEGLAGPEWLELFDPQPLVKLFTPDAGATWLLTEIDPDAPSMAFGLCGAPHKPNYVK